MSYLVLAPMEGLADDVLRDVLTSVSGYDWCVSEFVRVTGTRLPHSTFLRMSPELRNGSMTHAGTQTRVQLLGSDPDMMALNAAHLARLRPAGIDLNFGCPAPLVNRHRGGAALLGEPELMHSIVAAVRAAVPSSIPVTAKMRLGISDTSLALACAQALESGGAESIVVHARTKADGYKPPARWSLLAALRESLRVPLIANGEVWSVQDYCELRRVSACEHVMLGRGAVADPLLAERIRIWQREGVTDPYDDATAWQRLLPHIADFWQRVSQKLPPRHTPGRLKQWLGFMRLRYPQADALYRSLRELRHGDAISDALHEQGILQSTGVASESQGHVGAAKGERVTDRGMELRHLAG